MRTAISHLNHDPQKQEEAEMSVDRELILQGTHLRDVLLRTFEPNPEEMHEQEEELKGQTMEVEYSSEEMEIFDLQGAEEVQEARNQMTYGNEGVFRDDQRIQSWARRYAADKPVMVEGDPILEGLNQTQIKAMAMMIGQRICLVQGVSLIPGQLLSCFKCMFTATWYG